MLGYLPVEKTKRSPKVEWEEEVSGTSSSALHLSVCPAKPSGMSPSALPRGHQTVTGIFPQTKLHTLRLTAKAKENSRNSVLFREAHPAGDRLGRVGMHLAKDNSKTRLP